MGTNTSMLRQKLSLLNRASRSSSEDAVASTTRLEVLREVALSLLEEIDTLRNNSAPDVEQGIDLFDEVRRFETALIKRALKITQGSQTRAARLLGINATTLNYKIKRYNISLFGPSDYSREPMASQPFDADDAPDLKLAVGNG